MLHENLRVYRKSVELAGWLSKEIAKWPRGFGYMADQANRAMVSIILNTAEGNARKSKTERRRFFEIARASTAEVSACGDIARAFGLMNGEKVQFLKSELSAISKMLWGLIR